MKQYSVWPDGEVKKLFTFIEEGKAKGKNLSYLFDAYAKQNNRKANSVRNYYYAELLFLEQNPNKCKNLEINLDMHKKCEQKVFQQDEIKKVVCEILRLKSLGYSVRKACFKLSNGNLSEMVRLQNKYRTILTKQQYIIDECKNELKQKGFLIEEPEQKNNVIKMPTRQSKLSDNDINSLFLGLVKLVKKQALEDANASLKSETEFANNALRKSLVEIQAKDMELKKLRENFKLVCKQKQKLEQEIVLIRGKNAENLQNGLKNTKKMAKLHKFSKTYTQNEQTAT